MVVVVSRRKVVVVVVVVVVVGVVAVVVVVVVGVVVAVVVVVVVVVTAPAPSGALSTAQGFLRATLLGAGGYYWVLLLGGSWLVISGVISTVDLTPIRGLITPLITSHEPPSIRGLEFRT